MEVSNEEDLPPHILSPKVHLTRASGYFELEMFEAAEREIRALPDDEPWAKNGRILLVGIRQEREDWQGMQEIARGLRLEFPNEADWWVSDAFATRRNESIESARKILLKGLTVHGDSALIKYNLACYACLLNSPVECLDYLKEAVNGDDGFKRMALEDEDLEQVREALVKLGWDRVVV